jgi:hypothetical protein
MTSHRFEAFHRVTDEDSVRSCGIFCGVDWKLVTEASEKLVASIFRFQAVREKIFGKY